MSDRGQTEREQLYDRTVAGLRALGFPATADELEREKLLLFGDPSKPTPRGFLTLDGRRHERPTG